MNIVSSLILPIGLERGNKLWKVSVCWIRFFCERDPGRHENAPSSRGPYDAGKLNCDGSKVGVEIRAFLLEMGEEFENLDFFCKKASFMSA
jgi:hypothetical protein